MLRRGAHLNLDGCAGLRLIELLLPAGRQRLSCGQRLQISPRSSPTLRRQRPLSGRSSRPPPEPQLAPPRSSHAGASPAPNPPQTPEPSILGRCKRISRLRAANVSGSNLALATAAASRRLERHGAAATTPADRSAQPARRALRATRANLLSEQAGGAPSHTIGHRARANASKAGSKPDQPPPDRRHGSHQQAAGQGSRLAIAPTRCCHQGKQAPNQQTAARRRKGQDPGPKDHGFALQPRRRDQSGVIEQAEPTGAVLQQAAATEDQPIAVSQRSRWSASGGDRRC